MSWASKWVRRMMNRVGDGAWVGDDACASAMVCELRWRRWGGWWTGESLWTRMMGIGEARAFVEDESLSTVCESWELEKKRERIEWYLRSAENQSNGLRKVAVASAEMSWALKWVRRMMNRVGDGVWVSNDAWALAMVRKLQWRQWGGWWISESLWMRMMGIGESLWWGWWESEERKEIEKELNKEREEILF